jgi:plastocyanin
MKKAIVMCCLTFFTAGLVFLASDAPRDEGKVAALGVSAAYAQQAGVDTTVPEVGHRIVSISRDAGPSPTYLKAPPGTTVVWVNYSQYPVEILFTQKEVTLACKAPVHFMVGEDGTYVSDKIPMGAVASLCFVEKGNFEYYARKAVKMAYGAGDDQSQIRGTRGTITIE